jgi:hypothetical protein
MKMKHTISQTSRGLSGYLRRLPAYAVAGFLGILAGCGSTASAQAPGLPASDVALTVDAHRLLDASGEPVVLRAINLGNWLLIESWMYAQNTSAIPDQATFLSILRSRFGQAEADRLMALHRANWMTQRDFDAIADAGFNCVRIPVSHLVLESQPFVADEAGFDILASAFEMADRAGLYVILDMHSVPGGQSTDQPSGDITENNIWTDPVAQERLAWLWQMVARRFKNTPNFVAYDLINEPFGDWVTDIRPPLLQIVDRTIRSIREIDQERLILLPGTLQGISFYGDPADRGWLNTGFTEHAYPGIFDGEPATLGTHARFLANYLRERADLSRTMGVPFLLGEFNPVFDRAGGSETMREVFEVAEADEMHAAVWSYKIVYPEGGVGANNWYYATNAQPLGLGDIRSSSKATIEAAFNSLATMPLAFDAAYREAMLREPPNRVLPEATILPLTPPAMDEWIPWNTTDIGEVPRAGGQAISSVSDGVSAEWIELYTGGQDLFGTADSIRLASRTAPPASAVSGVFERFEGGRYGQAGVTIRASDSSNSAHVSLVLLPNGRLAVKSRPTNGSPTSERFVGIVGFPAGLALGRSSSAFAAWYTDADGNWRTLSIPETPAVGSSPQMGFFAAANRDGPLSVVRIQNPRLDAPGVFTASPTLHTGSNRLVNASFEIDAGTPSNAAGWIPFGDHMGRETGWTPVRDGNALLAYRHWQVINNNPSGVSQMLSGLTPGQRYTLTVYANRDTVAPGRSLADEVELRIETVGGQVRDLEKTVFDVRDIATGSAWSRLQLSFTATGTQHRLLLVAFPGSGQRDGALKFDGLVLEADPE